MKSINWCMYSANTSETLCDKNYTQVQNIQKGIMHRSYLWGQEPHLKGDRCENDFTTMPFMSKVL